MNRADTCSELETAFVSTLIGELMPGVLHNFANPLNGIMGRSKLLKRRLAESMRRLETLHPGFSAEFGEDRLMTDIEAIASEAERFFDIFRDLAGKVSVLAAREPERINLSQLIESEVRFADFYLDFKHDIKKNLRLDPNLPEIIGDAAGYSLCISALLNSARNRMKDCKGAEIEISTSHDETSVKVMFRDGGSSISGACERLTCEEGSAFDMSAVPEVDRGICHVCLLMKHYGAKVQIHGRDECNTILLDIPYR